MRPGVALLPLMAGLVFAPLRVALAIITPPTVTLEDASSGVPLGSAVAMSGELSAGTNPDTQPISELTPVIRYALDYLVTSFPTTQYTLSATGDPTSPDGTMPLSALQWDGRGIDSQGSVWQATGSTASPADQPFTTTAAQYGTSPALGILATFYFDLQLKVHNAWLYPWGTYATTLEFGYTSDSAGTSPLTVSFAVPPCLALEAPTSAIALTADPAAPAPVSAPLTATLKCNARQGETTALELSATALSDGTHTIPMSALTYAVGGASGPLSTTAQTVSAFSGPSAGQSIPVRFAVAPSWAYVPGTYTANVTATAHSANGAPDVSHAFANLTVAVPPRLLLSINTGSVSLVADPAGGAQNVAAGAAVLTIKSNYGTTNLAVSATTPASATNSLPVSCLRYQVSTAQPPSGGTTTVAALSLNRGATWDAFSNSAVQAASLTGASDGAVLTYDYEAVPNWTYKPGTYASHVTYTITGI